MSLPVLIFVLAVIHLRSWREQQDMYTIDKQVIRQTDNSQTSSTAFPLLFSFY